jgi:ferredoxin, 2Fe-2S
MATIRVIFENGESGRLIEFDPAEAPFQHDGQPGSILDVLLGHDVPLEHACGGNCAFTTCHVIVKQGFNKLSEASEQEEDLVDKAPGLTMTSRLGCRVVVEDRVVEIVAVNAALHHQPDKRTRPRGFMRRSWKMSTTLRFREVFRGAHRAIGDAFLNLIRAFRNHDVRQVRRYLAEAAALSGPHFSFQANLDVLHWDDTVRHAA